MQIEFDYYVTPDGEVVDLHDFDSRVILSHDGYGFSDLEWLTSRGPFQHGETALDFRLRPRRVRLVMRWKGRNRQGYWDARDTLVDAIRPNRSDDATPGRLRKVLPNGTVRDLAVQLDQGPTFGPEDPEIWAEWSFEQVVEFVAHDPTFFDPTQRVYTAAPLVGTGNIICPGTWLSWPVIEYVGPITNPVITNLAIGETITLTYAIAAGRTVTIDLRPDRKTVKDDLGTDLGYYVSGDLTTWKLQINPIVAGGTNQIQFAVGASGGGAAMRIYWYDRWIGI